MAAPLNRFARRSTVTMVLTLAFVVGLLASTATANHPGPQYDAAVAPAFVAANPTCSALINDPEVIELKIQPVTAGTFSLGSFSVTITLTTLLPAGGTLGGAGFDYTSTGGDILGVVSKGGPNANLYDYRPGTQTSDSSLHSPVNHSNNRFYGLSHISFCFVEAPAIGAIRINKTAKHATQTGGPNLVATFTIVDSQGASHLVTTDAAGTGCADGLALGTTQSITETTVPSGYAAPASIPNVNVTEGDCAGTTGAAVVVNVENIPLTNISYTVTSQQPGATNTTVNCYFGDIDGTPDHTQTISSGSHSFDDLEPTAPNTTLTCQFTVDP